MIPPQIIRAQEMARKWRPNNQGEAAGKTKNKPAETVPEKSAKAPAPGRFLKESCAELSRTFGPASKLTDLQQEELWKQYKGREFSWPLRVVEVTSGTFGGYNMVFKCGSNSPSFISDVVISYPEGARERVMQFQKGKVYKFEGRLKTYSRLTALMADPL